jgi:hypothetical protein
VLPSDDIGGRPMNTEIRHDPRYPISKRALQLQDVLLVSSFAIWAMLIGFAPVMTYRLLIA